MQQHELLKEKILETGFKLNFVSKKTGIPYDSLIQYLNGHRPIPEAKLRCICLTFEIDTKIFGLDGTIGFQSENQHQKEPA